LLAIKERPWFADMTNYKATKFIPEDFTWQQRKKFLHEENHYVWDEPYLFKIGVDNLLRRCVDNEEAKKILWQCHNSPYGGHFNGERPPQKYFNLVSISRHCSKMPTNIASLEMIVKDPDQCQSGMKCLYKVSLKWKCLIVGI